MVEFGLRNLTLRSNTLRSGARWWSSISWWDARTPPGWKRRRQRKGCFGASVRSHGTGARLKRRGCCGGRVSVDLNWEGLGCDVDYIETCLHENAVFDLRES